MLGKFCHKCLAETHHFCVRLALRVEVGTALAAAHRKTCEGILENLFKSQELQNGLVYSRVETEAALVRSDGRVELHSVASVHLSLALVILPCNAELDESFRMNDPLDDCVCFVFRILFDQRLKRFQNLQYCL